jgi:hypothetical protein
MKWFQFAAVALVSVLLGGCATTITNLTPSSHLRNANNIYPFAVQFKTSQKSIREKTIKPYVVVGADVYPMEPAPMLKNRWEAQVPVPAGTNIFYYRYKFDYQYDRIPTPGESSRLSPTYQLQIVDR